MHDGARRLRSLVRGHARQVVLCPVRPGRSRGAPCRGSERTEFDDWLADMVRGHGEFTVLVILTEIGERSVAPLCSTYLHVIGDEVDWEEVKIMFAGSGRKLGRRSLLPDQGAQRRPHRQSDGAPAPRRAGSQGHRGPHGPQRRPFLRYAGPPHQDRAGSRRMTRRPMRIVDTGLRPARWNVAMTAALAELHATRACRRYGALPPLSGLRPARAAARTSSTRPTGLLPAARASRSRAASPAAAPYT